MSNKKAKTKTKLPEDQLKRPQRKVYKSLEEWAKDFERQKQEQDNQSNSRLFIPFTRK